MSTGDDSTDDLGSMASVLGALAYAPGGEAALAAGVVIDGLYRIEKPIGAGGMGAVYLAKDLRLGRAVAVKLGRTLARDALARMAREAGALAMLSHPNVVVVHQVGEHDGQVYLAMEHVAGTTLRGWLTAKPRGWREIVTMVTAAGDGLAAAHAAGLVHRDFKPDNVLVGEDGRPRVADFGLVRATAGGAANDGAEATRDDAAMTGSGGASATRTGAVLGTPAYMAPEQLDGAAVDARADQFAFAATAWEALFGARPFAGHTPAELRAAISSSPPSTERSEARGRVPAHVVAALRRALQPSPDERWPALAPLLAELRRDPARTQRRIAFGGGALVAVAAALAVPSMLRDAPADPCAGGEARIATAWSPSAAAKVRDAFAAAGQPWAATAADQIVRGLDRWTQRWVHEERTVCRARWSPALRDRAVVCLARRRAELAAAADVLAQLPRDSLGKGLDVVAALGGPETCADPAYLAAVVPPPTDARVAAAVAAQDPEIGKVRALLAAGRLAEAEAAAGPLVAAAVAIGDRALVARSRAAFGAVLTVRKEYPAALTELGEAYFLARAAGDGHTAAEAAARAARVFVGLSRHDESASWARLASIEADAAADPRLRVEATTARAVASRVKGDLAGARGFADQALAEARGTGDPLVQALALDYRADILRDLGERAAALQDLDEAIALVRGAYGDQHYVLINLGADRSFTLRYLGRYDEAIVDAQAALALAEQVFGPAHRATATPRSDLAIALAAANRPAEALPLWDRIIADDSTLSPESWDVASDLNNQALALTALGRYDEAIAAWQRASTIWSKVSGADAAEVAIAEGGIASALLEGRRFAEAEAAATRAIDVYAHHPDNPTVASPLTVRGAARIALRKFAGARADLERALALRDRPDAEPNDLANTRLYLAEAVAGLGDHERARALATAVLPVVRDDYPAMAARAEALLGGQR